MDDICRLCNEVNWILLASLRNLFSTVGWWRKFMQIPFLGATSLWPEFRKVRYREGTVGGRSCCQWLPDLCQKQMSQCSTSVGSYPLWWLRLWKEEWLAVGYSTPMGKSNTERWKKAAYMELCVRLPLCLAVKLPDYNKSLCNEWSDFAPWPFCIPFSM